MIDIRNIEREYLKNEIPEFSPGDTVDVYLKIKEADKERMQIFSGIVIARRGSGTGATFTVRRIVQGEGVERIFPLHSPRITGIIVRKKGDVRRAKLYFLRKRTGKSAKVKELIEKIEEKPKEEKPETPSEKLEIKNPKS